MALRTSNPALSSATFRDLPRTAAAPMTISGTVQKAGILLVLLLFAAGYTWNLAAEHSASLGACVFGGLIGGLIVAFATIFKPTWSAFTAPVYAICEGLFLGAISAFFEAKYPGIVSHAIGFTIGTFAALLGLYATRIVRATEKFKLGVFAATGGIFLVYLATFVLGLFGVDVGFVQSSGPIAIAFSLFVVVIAALNLVLDFDLIETGARSGAPKYMEWYAAFGLLVTLVWLYLEILRLLSKLQER